MFCPKCGVRNLEDVKFCRACGANLSLVPQALAGRLPEGALKVEGQERGDLRERKDKVQEPPTLEKGLGKVFTGLAVLIIFLLGFFYWRGGFLFWVWLIIPALANFGEGVGQIIRSRGDRGALPNAGAFPGAVLPAPSPRAELPAPHTSEIIPPPVSVTEATTRGLRVPAERQAGDA